MNNAVRQWVRFVFVLGLGLSAYGAQAQSFRVQCPATTTQHPAGVNADGSTIKCQQVAGGDGYASMADGSQIYRFGFGPLSGLKDIYNGLPGTQLGTTFNTTFGANGTSGDTGTPSVLVGQPSNSFTFNGAIGLTNDVKVDPWTAGSTYEAGVIVGTVTGLYTSTTGGVAGATAPSCATVGASCSDGALNWSYTRSLLDGHVDPRAIMDEGVMNASAPAGIGNTNHLRENIVAQDSIRCVDRVRAIRPIDRPIEGNEGGG